MKVDHPDSTSADTLTYGKGSKDCFTGDTKVLVLNRNKEVISIELQKLVSTKENYTLFNYDYNGNFKETELVNVFSQGEVTELIEIEMEDGYIFKCTPDHEILTSDGFKAAKDLTNQDEIINLND